MLAAFQMMDKSGTGNLNKTDFKTAMTQFGENFSDAEVDEMFKEADVDGDGEINYEEFLKVMVSGECTAVDFNMSRYSNNTI
jgi:calmodulin